ncbi:MAG: hypothetical protein IIA35_06155 [Proteobacteria bacterium]|nr:hypothetical protein [Pseudomonadota bacterium]
MKRSAPLMPILALAFVIALPAPGPGPSPGAWTGSGAAFAQGGLLQCMEQCIRHEGGNTATNKATCKSRCANVPSQGVGQGGAPDCMARYKDCRGACAKNKSCRKACKKRLMGCK